MARVLIVGYGNPLRGDDALGWHAAQQLSENIRRQDVEILTCHQLTPELAERLSRSERVIFIDAACVGVPGEVSQQRVSPAVSAAVDFTHHFDVPALLACTQILYGVCPQAVLCSVAAESFELTESLSPAVEAAVPELLERVYRLLE
ncbi:MAG: hydrogenase maturation protease [Chloroflexi bacterium]|nr:hydrogenase maturation protease [Chloroflexota bacterium]